VNETQCLASHLTTFAGGFVVLPEPIKWEYVFANADFARNKTIYVTMIVVLVLYVLLTMFARWRDLKDVQKVSGVIGGWADDDDDDDDDVGVLSWV
jgi:hypothetical protein